MFMPSRSKPLLFSPTLLPPTFGAWVLACVMFELLGGRLVNNLREPPHPKHKCRFGIPSIGATHHHSMVKRVFHACGRPHLHMIKQNNRCKSLSPTTWVRGFNLCRCCEWRLRFVILGFQDLSYTQETKHYHSSSLDTCVWGYIREGL